MNTQLEETPVTKAIIGFSAMAQAIDELVAQAGGRLSIFDRDLADYGFNSAERFNRLKVFLLANRSNSLQIVVHRSEYLERDCTRMMILLRQFPHAVTICKTLPEAQRVSDAFMIARGLHYFHRFHGDHPRAELVLNDESGAGVLQKRFDEIVTYSEPAIGASVLGL